MKDVRVWAMSAEEAARAVPSRPARPGLNVLREEKATPRVFLFLRQFQSPVVLLLLAGVVLCLLLGERIDAAAIFAILVVNALIGFFQERRAEKAVAALKKLSSPRARVRRDGSEIEVRTEDVAIGDILVLEAGDWVAADARLIEAHGLTTGESALTGESMPVEKQVDVIPADTATADRSNMVFGGTTILTGRARAVVTAIGMDTEMGRIAAMLEQARPGPTPLQQRLAQLSNQLLVLCLGVIAVIAILGLVHGEAWLSVAMSGISLAVAAVPEGLPTVVTIALALAIRRMAHRKAIVRYLPAVETLGSTDVVCTDKTGTLTTGVMSAREIVFEGHVWPADEELGDSAAFRRLIFAVVQCNNATLTAGDPTEAALLKLADRHGLLAERLPRESERPFDSVRKRMSVVVQGVTYLKGAPESVLPLCRLESEEREKIDRLLDELLSKGRRILAVAMRENSGGAEENLKFLGMVALADPPRAEAREAIQRCRKASIQVVMITGDHPRTARAVAAELGIESAVTLTGPDLEGMSIDELAQQVEKVGVYARVTPEHKLKIVRAWKKLGRVVAMTGDGVNDAPALKEASIGISMGRSGTEVARQASSLILTDDHFATIVSAVEEGRAIYGNIRRTIQYLLSGNIAEILVMLGAAVAGWGTPLTPIHLLWINLVTDGFPALALAAEPVPRDGLAQFRKPSSRFDRRFYGMTVGTGLLVGAITLAVYAYGWAYHGEAAARTYAFSFLVFEELFRSFAARSEVKTFFQLGFRSNLFHVAAVSVPILFQIVLHHTTLLSEIFDVQPIGWSECFAFLGLSLIPVTILELSKSLKSV